MNKRLFLGLFLLLTIAFSVFAAPYTSPSSGILRIANEGELPSGMFVKAQGYLPGDSITINNELNGSSIELLNLGNYSGEDSLLILTKQAANALGINTSGEYEIKLAVRQGTSDSSAIGVVSITKNLKPEVVIENKEPLVEPTVETSIEEKSESLEVSKEVPEVIEEPEPNIAVENPTYFEEQYFDEENYNVIASATDIDKALEEYDNLESNAEEVYTSDTIDEIADKKNDTVEELQESEKYTESPMDKSEASSSESVVVEYEIYKDDEFESVDDEVIADFDMSEENELYLSYVDDLKENEDTVNTEIVSSEEDVASLYVEEEVAKVNSEEQGIEEESEEFYAPIVLVPAVSKTPENDVIQDVVESTKVNTVVDTPVKEVEKNTKDFSSYIVKTEKNLIRNSYYIQIATLKDEENITNLLNKYNKYPIVLVPTNNNKGYKVNVGPLTVDEYGAVFEKFKSYGFKDCFVKKIK